MRILSAAALALLVAAPALAQQAPVTPQPGEEVADRVVAVVGDTSLLLSDVVEEMQRLAAAGRPVPEDPTQRDAFLRNLAEERIDDLLLVQGARKAGILVLEAEVQGVVDQQVQRVRQSFPSEAAFVAALANEGLTQETYRQQIARQAMEQRMVQRFIGQRMARMPVPAVSDAEARAVFEAQRESLGNRPANVSFQQAVVTPQPTAEARAAARREAEEVAAKLVAGEKFDDLARRYSDDPGSKERGGDLGWFRAGTMVPAFDAAVFGMRAGDTSPIVETDFGFHIIKLERVRGAERQARHILIAPEVTAADAERARVRADSIATAVRGGASLTELAAKVKTPSDQVVNRSVPTDQLPQAYSLALSGTAAGQVVGPFELQGPRGVSYVVARVTDRQDAGAFTYEDVAEQARARVREQKQMQQLVAELRRDIHVAVVL